MYVPVTRVCIQECACMSHVQEYQKSVYIYVGFISSTHPYTCVSFIHNTIHCNTHCNTLQHTHMCVSFHTATYPYVCLTHTYIFVNTSIYVCVIYTQCNTLQHTLQHTATHPYMWVSFRQHIHICGFHLYTLLTYAFIHILYTHTLCTHCNTLQRTLQHTAIHPYMWVSFIHTLHLYALQHTATHTTTHCNAPIYVGLIYARSLNSNLYTFFKHTLFVHTATHCKTHYNTLQCTHTRGSHLHTLVS